MGDASTQGAANVNIESSSVDSGLARAQGVTGGIVDASVNDAKVTVTPTVASYIASNATVNVSNNITMAATAIPEGDASTKGTGIGGAHFSGSFFQAGIPAADTAHNQRRSDNYRSG